MNESFKSAFNNGTIFLAIRSSDTPSYFAYDTDGSINDTVCNYYNNMGTNGDGLKNAENLLVYLATEYGGLSASGTDSNSTDVSSGNESSLETSADSNSTGANLGNDFLFILGTVSTILL